MNFLDYLSRFQDPFKGIQTFLEEKPTKFPAYRVELFFLLGKLVRQTLDKVNLDFKDGFNVQMVLQLIQYISNLDDSSVIENFTDNGLTLLISDLMVSLLHKCRIGPDETADQLYEDLLETMTILAENNEKLKSLLVHGFVDRLLQIVTSPNFRFSIKYETLKSVNMLLEDCHIDVRDALLQSPNHCEMLCNVAELIPNGGDYEFQVALTESLFRMTHKTNRQNFAKGWFSKETFFKAFSNIKDAEFEVDCREFLNVVNSHHNSSVVSYPCEKCVLGDFEIYKPNDQRYNKFWVDFNTVSKRISMFCRQDICQDTLWETVSIWNDNVICYDVSDDGSNCILHIQTLSNAKDLVDFGPYFCDRNVKITFQSQFKVSTVIDMLFSKEKKKTSIPVAKVKVSVPKEKIPVKGYSYSCAVEQTISEVTTDKNLNEMSKKVKVSVPCEGMQFQCSSVRTCQPEEDIVIPSSVPEEGVVSVPDSQGSSNLLANISVGSALSNCRKKRSLNMSVDSGVGLDTSNEIARQSDGKKRQISIHQKEPMEFAATDNLYPKQVFKVSTTPCLSTVTEESCTGSVKITDSKQKLDTITEICFEEDEFPFSDAQPPSTKKQSNIIKIEDKKNILQMSPDSTSEIKMPKSIKCVKNVFDDKTSIGKNKSVSTTRIKFNSGAKRKADTVKSERKGNSKIRRSQRLKNATAKPETLKQHEIDKNERKTIFLDNEFHSDGDQNQCLKYYDFSQDSENTYNVEPSQDPVLITRTKFNQLKFNLDRGESKLSLSINSQSKPRFFKARAAEKIKNKPCGTKKVKNPKVKTNSKAKDEDKNKLSRRKRRTKTIKYYADPSDSDVELTIESTHNSPNEYIESKETNQGERKKPKTTHHKKNIFSDSDTADSRGELSWLCNNSSCKKKPQNRKTYGMVIAKNEEKKKKCGTETETFCFDLNTEKTPEQKRCKLGSTVETTAKQLKETVKQKQSKKMNLEDASEDDFNISDLYFSSPNVARTLQSGVQLVSSASDFSNELQTMFDQGSVSDVPRRKKVNNIPKCSSEVKKSPKTKKKKDRLSKIIYNLGSTNSDDVERCRSEKLRMETESALNISPLVMESKNFRMVNNNVDDYDNAAYNFCLSQESTATHISNIKTPKTPFYCKEDLCVTLDTYNDETDMATSATRIKSGRCHRKRTEIAENSDCMQNESDDNSVHGNCNEENLSCSQKSLKPRKLFLSGDKKKVLSNGAASNDNDEFGITINFSQNQEFSTDVDEFEQKPLDKDGLETDQGVTTGVKKLIKTYGCEIQKHVQERMKPIEKIIKVTVKSSNKHIHSIMGKQQGERNDVLRDFKNILDTELENMEKEISKTKKTDFNIKESFKQQLQALTHSRVAQQKSIKKLVKAESKCSADLQKLDDMFLQDRSDLLELLQLEMNNFHDKVSFNQQQQDILSVKHRLQMLFG